jgi:hypothetical protein
MYYVPLNLKNLFSTKQIHSFQRGSGLGKALAVALLKYTTMIELSIRFAFIDSLSIRLFEI